MPFRIIRNDITKVKADAIVDTANPEPTYGRGTDYAVYMAAGAEDLLAERRKIGRMRSGEVFITPAFRLPAKYIIHAVGPGWSGGDHGELACLASCYRKSLLLAKQMRLRSIAFPLISTGVNGFPKDEALRTALDAIAAFLENDEMDVTLVVLNKEAFVLSAGLAEDVRQFIDDNYADELHAREYGHAARAERLSLEEGGSLSTRSRIRGNRNVPGRQAGHRFFEDDAPVQSDGKACGMSCKCVPGKASASVKPAKGRGLREIMENIGESFSEKLLRLIGEKGLAETDVYKKAFIDRKLFSKIRCNPGYSPKKQTAVALAFALRLDLDGTADLLKSAGLALPPGSKFDLIVLYCLENGIYDLFDINALLFKYDQPMLGC